MPSTRSSRTLTRALIFRAQTGDDAAMEQLLRENSPLVSKAARMWSGFSVPFEDLVQEGNIGLLIAIRGFDLSRDVAFSTYAWWWVRQYVARGFHHLEHAIWLPAHATDASARIYRARQAFALAGNEEPTREEMLAATRLRPSQLDQCEDLPAVTVSLDNRIEDDWDSGVEMLVSEEDAYASLEMRETTEEVAEMLAILPDRERLVIELRFGLGDFGKMTLAEVGKELRISREGVRHIEVRAIKRLRERWGKGEEHERETEYEHTATG